MPGAAPVAHWLSVDRLRGQFGQGREQARRRYRDFVPEGKGCGIWAGLRQRIYLGDVSFVERMQARARMAGDSLSVPRAQRRSPPEALTAFLARHDGRNAGSVAAYATGAYSHREISEEFAVHLATVGRIVRGAMQRCDT